MEKYIWIFLVIVSLLLVVSVVSVVKNGAFTHHKSQRIEQLMNDTVIYGRR